MSDGDQACRNVAKAEEETESRFQYILAAPTSIVTKTGEPSLTYINQGQSYEIKIKKLGDISGMFRASGCSINFALQGITRRSGSAQLSGFVSTSGAFSTLKLSR